MGRMVRNPVALPRAYNKPICAPESPSCSLKNRGKKNMSIAPAKASIPPRLMICSRVDFIGEMSEPVKQVG